MILSGDNITYLEELYEQYCNNPNLLSQEWQNYFINLESSNHQNGHNPSQNTFVTSATKENRNNMPIRKLLKTGEGLDQKLLGVQSLLESYRRFGNLAADLDPLGLRVRNFELLKLPLYGLEPSDLQREFTSPLPSLERAKLADLITRLESCYCSSIGIEYAYVRNTQERDWIERYIEAEERQKPIDLNLRYRLYEKLVQAETFEKFLAKKYVGKKRFSIEGCETFIPLLDTAVEEASRLGIECIVAGMAHRGRLNVLVNIMDKPTSLIFAEFEENYDPETLDYADVKYHLGYSHDRTSLYGKNIHLSLAFNPSHLEAVNPVVLGSIRARQTKYQDHNRKKFMPILIHGDAAFMGQGVVPESLNLCNLDGYTVGGTLHILINNQIGFTTSPRDSRSTEYATDIAKGFQIPIFHVNGDDPEAAFRAMQLALEYRQTFGKDVIVDLIGYRRLGHNETDEPAFTQPLMYKKIKNQKNTLTLYRKKLENDSDTSISELSKIEKNCRSQLEQTFNVARQQKIRMRVDTMKGNWSAYAMNGSSDVEAKTSLLVKHLENGIRALTSLPKDFHLHSKIKRLLDNRTKMYREEIPLDWGLAEALAFASILQSKHKIRLSGQDSKRGTFSHRHCVFSDIETGEEYVPLNFISEGQGKIEVCNSPLSEFSVLGFEYGYTLADPDALVLWEAQFGDFANGAQIIFDQFISSSEVKWRRMSGLVVLLPHGYEGQGPEHSSARLERFLQLCANDNMQVCNCSTPAQYFHLLRRQILRKFRKPLIIMTPKSLLRLPEASSQMDELRKGKFQEVLLPREKPDASKVKRLIFCSGKFYYDLQAGLQKEKYKKIKDKICIVRVEQYYPSPDKELKKVIENYFKACEYIWAQEEPINQGAYSYINHKLSNLLPKNKSLYCVSRPESSSPSVGLFKLHQKEQNELVEKALAEML